MPSVVSFRALTKITFQLSNKAFFDLFVVEVDPVFRLDPSKASASQLLSIPTLQDVHVKFESPHRGARTSPWGRLERKIGLDRYDGAYYVCCHCVVGTGSAPSLTRSSPRCLELSFTLKGRSSQTRRTSGWTSSIRGVRTTKMQPCGRSFARKTAICKSSTIPRSHVDRKVQLIA